MLHGIESVPWSEILHSLRFSYYILPPRILGIKMSTHSSNPAVVKRLRRAEGHLRSITAMLEDGRSCVEIAQQLQAVESAIHMAKKALVHDHIDHCLEDALQLGSQDATKSIEEFKAITRFL